MGIDFSVSNVNTLAGQIFAELDAKDGKVDNKINKDTWNVFAQKVGGKNINNFIEKQAATNSIMTYLQRNQNKVQEYFTTPQTLTDDEGPDSIGYGDNIKVTNETPVENADTPTTTVENPEQKAESVTENAPYKYTTRAHDTLYDIVKAKYGLTNHKEIMDAVHQIKTANNINPKDNNIPKEITLPNTLQIQRGEEEVDVALVNDAEVKQDAYNAKLQREKEAEEAKADATAKEKTDKSQELENEKQEAEERGLKYNPEKFRYELPWEATEQELKYNPEKFRYELPWEATEQELKYKENLEYTCANLVDKAKSLGINGVYHDQYMEINDPKELENYIHSVNEKINHQQKQNSFPWIVVNSLVAAGQHDK